MDIKNSIGEYNYFPRSKECYDIFNDNGEYVCQVWNDSIPPEEILSIAELITDAGTTKNKCGLLPSELLKQRDDLLNQLAALKKAI